MAGQLRSSIFIHIIIMIKRGESMISNTPESMISSILFVIRSHALIARADVCTTGIHQTNQSDRVMWCTYCGIRGYEYSIPYIEQSLMSSVDWFSSIWASESTISMFQDRIISCILAWFCTLSYMYIVVPSSSSEYFSGFSPSMMSALFLDIYLYL